jgi:hypothetical protein
MLPPGGGSKGRDGGRKKYTSRYLLSELEEIPR